MVAEGERQPILVAWEDLHWADPTTLEFLGLVIAAGPHRADAPRADFSPGVQPALAAAPTSRPLVLTRLERPQVEALITQRAGGKTSRSKWCSTSSPKRMGCRCMLKS